MSELLLFSFPKRIYAQIPLRKVVIRSNFAVQKDFLHEGSVMYCLVLCAKSLQSHPNSLLPLWTVARQAPLGGLPCSPPGDLPDSGIEHAPLVSPVLAGVFFTASTTWEIYLLLLVFINCAYFPCLPSFFSLYTISTLSHPRWELAFCTHHTKVYCYIVCY